MGQVPEILIIGNGRLATHWRHYLSLLDLSFYHWDRSQDKKELIHLLEEKKTIFLAIADSAIENFYQDHLKASHHLVIHFSGALYNKEILGLHPLQSFSKDRLYSLEDYKKIPLICDQKPEYIKKALAFLDNPFSYIEGESKPLYHALCVLMGNLPQKIWHDSEEIIKELSLSKKLFHPYLEKIVDNFCDTNDYLTGPLKRGDQLSIDKNRESLAKFSPKNKETYDFFYQRFLRDKTNEY